VSADQELDLDFVDPSRREEVRRRTEILKKHDAAPTVASARAAATEMGVPLSEFYSLLRIFREGRRSLGPAGALARRGAAESAAGPIASLDQVDFSFVDPSRLAETRRRVAVLIDYENANGTEDLDGALARLGIGKPNFYKLLRAWREHQRPELLPGASARHFKGTKLSLRQQEIVASANAELGAGTSATRVAEHARAAMEAENVHVPSDATMRLWIRRLRTEAARGSPAGSGLAVDHCALELAVPQGAAGTAPIATFVLDLEHRAVLGCALTAGMPGPGTVVRAMLDALDAIGRVGAGEGPVYFAIATDGDDRWSQLLYVLRDAGLRLASTKTASLRAGKVVTATIGMMAGGLKFRVRSTHMPPAARKPHGAVQTLADAEAMVRARLAGDVSGSSPLARLDQRSRDMLRSKLEALAAEWKD